MTNPATVAHLVSTLGVGGQEMVILSLVEHMDRDRYRPVVMALHESGPVGAMIENLGIEVEVIGAPGLGGIQLVRRLVSRLEANRVDILHTHNPAPHQHGAAARLLTRFTGLIHTKHGRNNFPTRSRRWAEQLAGRMTDMVVAVSHDSAEVARTIDRVPARKLRVIHNGIALDRIRPANVVAADRPPRAVHVARLNRIKDQPTLLRAAGLVARQVPGFSLQVVGDGPMNDVVRGLAHEMGLDQVVKFAGMQSDITPWLADADLFVLSSLSEGISITLLEAMGAGLPIVATDVGGNREVVRPGENGLLVPPRDPQALADAMISLLSDPALRTRMGKAGRARVESDFNIERTAAAYDQAYSELLSRRKLPRLGAAA